MKRRQYDRFSVDHKIVFQVVGKDGSVAERVFRGELDNISQGGLSFLMRIVKRENRWQLFDRHLLVSVDFEESKLQFKGVVVAITVQDLQNHDYAIHVVFDEPVAEDIFKPLVPTEPVEDELPEEEGTEENLSVENGVEDES